jgi:CRISPR system Cascade subunit CasA
MYDLRFESWIPFRRASDKVEWLPPFALTDGLDEDPIVAIASPRVDFDAAILEFLIGLFSVTLSPDDEARWAELSTDPPKPEKIRSALTQLPGAFTLDGDGPRIFQDLDPFEDEETTPIESLLMDAPGEQTRRYNADIFVKRDRIVLLGRPAAAMALITMQTYAPTGGQGYRTSLRGGGPLTTLADPRAEPRIEPLWRLLWANAETRMQLDARNGDRATAWTPADTYPWLAPTRTSNPKKKGVPTHVADAAPEQVYFGLPRRIRFVVIKEPGTCALTGRPDTAHIAAFRATNYGVQYLGWIHPLTPYRYDKESGLLPIHGHPGGVGWRDWLGLLFASAEEKGSRPAQAVAHYGARRASGPFRLRVSGYDVDNMKARSWTQAELPAFPDAILERVRAFASDATAAADQAAGAVMQAVKAGLLQRPKDAPGDYRYLKNKLWAETQGSFFEFVDRLAHRADLDGPELREKFRHVLRRVALRIFDDACPLDPGFEISHLRRPIAARHGLVMTLEGYRKGGVAFYKALNLAPPEATRSKHGRAA